MPTSETACSCLQNCSNANNIIRVRYLTFSAQCYRFLWNQIHSSNSASWIFLNIQTKNEKITKFRISYTLLCRTNSNSMQSNIFKLKLLFLLLTSKAHRISMTQQFHNHDVTVKINKAHLSSLTNISVVHWKQNYAYIHKITEQSDKVSITIMQNTAMY